MTLSAIRSPVELKALPAADLHGLAREIRGLLIENVRRSGGHLGPNLGVVELTIALHRVFESPHDMVLFDTGHQSYVHKLLTGRAAEFATLRRGGGLSGYPSAAESPHDRIENSHASTALSYADGVAKGLRLGGSRRKVVVVVGDGALTGGMAWEALSNLAETSHPVIVILNDNGRSYAPTAGGLGEHLASLRAGARPSVFESLGLHYRGPVDGHDIPAMERAFRGAAAIGSPVVVHCLTRKGKGYRAAEQHEADHLHALPSPTPSAGPTWKDAFADEIVDIGADRPDVVCVTAAMLEPTGLAPFAARFPERVFDVGIAEQHAVTSAAGMAMAGFHPVVAVFSTFLGRAFDQIMLDVALHRLPVTFVLDHAGVTGDDGASHHGMWDSSLLSLVPGLRLWAPRDLAQLRRSLREAVDIADGPTAIRYPHAPAPAEIPAVEHTDAYDVLYQSPGARCLLVSVGPMAEACVEAARELAGHGIPITVVDPRRIAPLDPALVALAAGHENVLTVEDGVAAGALGGRLAQVLAIAGARTRTRTHALPASFLPHGSRADLLRICGLDPSGIREAVLQELARVRPSGPQ